MAYNWRSNSGRDISIGGRRDDRSRNTTNCSSCGSSAQHQEERQGGKIVDFDYIVTYHSRSHLSILLHSWGWASPSLVLYGVFNVIIMVTLLVLRNEFGINLGGPDKDCHQYLGLLVSFLLVARVATSFRRYSDAREYLRIMNQNCEQLIKALVVYSNTDTRDEAKEWRNECTNRVLVLLRTSMSVCDYHISGGVKAVDLPEVEGDVLQDLATNLPPSRWVHDDRTDYEENLRIPIRISYLLRKSIRSQESRLEPTIPVISESELHAFLNRIMDGYHKYVYALSRAFDTTVRTCQSFRIFFCVSVRSHARPTGQKYFFNVALSSYWQRRCHFL